MLPRIHCITDFTAHDRAALDHLDRLVHAGVDAVQVRAKSLTDRQLLAFTTSVVQRLAGRAVVLVDDRVDVALAAGAGGVHVGHHDLPVAAVRRLVPPGFLVGATCRDATEVRGARTAGADYAGVGPVWATTTKAGLPDPLGPGVLAEAARELPSVAVGGVHPGRVAEALAAGAHGVAMASALCRGPDPERAVQEVVRALAA